MSEQLFCSDCNQTYPYFVERCPHCQTANPIDLEDRHDQLKEKMMARGITLEMY